MHSESGNHFIENQQDAVFSGQLPQRRQEVRSRRHDSHVPGDRLDDDAGKLIPVGLDQLLDRTNIIIGSGERMFGKVIRHTR